VIAGRSVTYGGASFTDAGGADSTWRHTIDWGDGSASSSTTVRRQGALPRLGKNFSAAGTYVVRRQVRDKDGTTGSRTFVVSVRPNAVPTASAGGPYTGRAGTSLRFTGAGSSDPDGDALRYRWEFGDGTTSTSTSPYKRYGSSGTYVVRLVVTDPSGAKDTASTTATIAAAY
jgi:PKD repeat protein